MLPTLLESPDSTTMSKRQSLGYESPMKGLITENIPEKPNKHQLGWIEGVYIPTCENMWGVIIFLRFHYIVGSVGVSQALIMVLVLFLITFCTTWSAVACVTTGSSMAEESMGPYQVISRSVGPYMGMSVGLSYWLAITLLAVLESLGAVEVFLEMTNGHHAFPMVAALGGSLCFLSLSLVVWLGSNAVNRVSISFIVLVTTTFILYIVMIVRGGFSWDQLQANLKPPVCSAPLSKVVAIIYPCFTGILSGANRTFLLKDPIHAVKMGSFGAICSSFLLYSLFILLWGLSRPLSEYYPCEAMDADTMGKDYGSTLYKFLNTYAWPHPTVTLAGIVIASLAQALQCLMVAPRLLNSIVSETEFPYLWFLRSKSDEPTRALFATYVVGASLVFIGKIDYIAPVLSMCFLIKYIFLNVACTLLSFVEAPSWRHNGVYQVTKRRLNMLIGFLGSVSCAGVMVFISTFWAAITMLLAFVLYVGIDIVGERVEWGTGIDGLKYHLALSALHSIRRRQTTKVNWRPQVLVICPKDHPEIPGFLDSRGHDILRLQGQLRKNRGMCIVSRVVHSKGYDNREEDLIQLKQIFEDETITGFAEILEASSWGEGASCLVQVSGLGPMKPNTVLMHWPRSEDSKEVREFYSVVKLSLSQHLSVLCGVRLNLLPTVRRKSPLKLDIWWLYNDDGLICLIAWLLRQHIVWRDSRFRVLTVLIGDPKNLSIIEATRQVLETKLRRERLTNVCVEIIVISPTSLPAETLDECTSTHVPSHGSSDEILVKTKKGLGGPQQNVVNLVIQAVKEESSLSKDEDVLKFIQAGTQTVVEIAEGGRLPYRVLNREFRKWSSGADLCVISMPHITLEDDPLTYIRNCEQLAFGLQALVFVHATGMEVFDIRA